MKPCGCKPGDKELCFNCLMNTVDADYIRNEIENEGHDDMIIECLQSYLDKKEKDNAVPPQTD